MKAPRIKVLHCVSRLLPDGAQQMLLKLAEYVDRDRFEFQVVTLLPDGGLEDKFRALGIEPHCLHWSSGGTTPRALRELCGLVHDRKPDVLQGWMQHGNLALLAAARLTRNTSPVVWNIRRGLDKGYDERAMTRFLIRISKFFSRSVDSIIYCGDRVFEQHKAYGFRSKAHVVIPNGFRLHAFQPNPEAGERLRAELGLNASTVIAGMAGRFHPQKDHRNLLAASSHVAREFSDFALVLVGREVNEANVSLMNMINEFGLQGRVHLLGQRSDVAAILPGFDFFCLASQSEGFPNVVGEAMACGVPCVVTDAGAAGEVVANTGLVVPTKDSDAFAAAMRSILASSPAKRAHLGNEARKRVISEFSIERVVRMYEDEYEKRVGRVSGTGGQSNGRQKACNAN